MDAKLPRLAGRIYQPLAQLYDLDPADQSLLEAAARLQDVGYLINYDQHHKHSYHLILHSGLPGFQPHELELIANIARYHRGSKPKPKHANYQRLSPEDQEARSAAGCDPTRGRRFGPQPYRPGAGCIAGAGDERFGIVG